MIEIKVLGTGCAGCKALHETVLKAVEALSIEANVVKEEDLIKMMKYNVMRLPALVINEQVVSVGKKLTLQEVKELLQKEL